MGPGGGGRQQFREQGEIVADVFQDVHEEDEPGLVDQRAEVRGGPPLEEMDLGKAGAGPVDGLGRGVDADAAVLVGQAADIAAGPAADVDDRHVLRRGHDGRGQPPHDAPPPDEPPMALFDVGVELELLGLHDYQILDFQLEVDAQAVVDLAADQVDQSQHVLAGALGLGDDEIGVPIADHRAADAGPLQAGLLDQLAGAGAAGILEDAAGALVAHRLRRPS